MADSTNKLVDPLLHFLEISSISTKDEFMPDMDNARHFLIDFFSDLKFKVKVLKGIKHDAVYAERIFDKNNPTVLIYGHYDVQPPEPLEEWKTNPFEPTIKNRKIFARGVTDNKAQIMIHSMAIKSLIEEIGSLPINIKFIIEGEEEIGSPSVEKLMEKYSKSLFTCNYLFVSDSQMLAKDKPTIDISLRGLLYTEIEIQTAKHDLHSGQYGGLAENPVNILSHIISNLKTNTGKVMIPGFYKNVARLSNKEKNDFKKLGYSKNKIIRNAKLYDISKNFKNYPVYQRVWTQPTLDVNGIWGGYQDEGEKTIIPASAGAKISMRLVPNQDPDKIYKSFVKHIAKFVPNSAKYTITRYADCLPYKSPTNDPVFNLVKKSLKIAFGKEPVFTGVGGSIGFVPIAAKELKVPVIMVGFGLPTDNLHAPNEHFSLSNYYKGIDAMKYFYSNLGNFVQNK